MMQVAGAAQRTRLLPAQTTPLPSLAADEAARSAGRVRRRQHVMPAAVNQPALLLWATARAGVGVMDARMQDSPARCALASPQPRRLRPASSTHLRVRAPQQEHHARALLGQVCDDGVCELLPAALGVRGWLARPHREHCAQAWGDVAGGGRAAGRRHTMRWQAQARLPAAAVSSPASPCTLTHPLPPGRPSAPASSSSTPWCAHRSRLPCAGTAQEVD